MTGRVGGRSSRASSAARRAARRFMKGIEEYVREVVGEGACGPRPRRTTVPSAERPAAWSATSVGTIERLSSRGDTRCGRVPGSAVSAPATADSLVARPDRSSVGMTARRRRASGDIAVSEASVSASPLPAATRRRSAGRWSRGGTCCSSCRRAPASRSATSCPGSRAAARRSWSSPADRADGRPGGEAAGAGPRGRAHPLRARSRRPRAQVCLDYLDGRLDFLFIAPERLRVPGFPEMLARRKPSLVAVDEAHCISPVGARLPARLPHARRAPAAAAPRARRRAHRHGDAAGAGRHRRAARPARRPRASSTAFGARTSRSRWSRCRRARGADGRRAGPARAGRRPAIVYAPTRKEAEELARRCGGRSAPRPTTRAWTRGAASACRPRSWAAGSSDRGDDRVRHGDRQGGRPHGDAHRAAGQRRGLLPGDRPRRARREALARHPAALVRRPPHARVLPRARLPRAGGARALFRAADGRAAARSPSCPDAPAWRRRIFEKALEKLWIHGGAGGARETSVRVGRRDGGAPTCGSASTRRRSSTRCSASPRRTAAGCCTSCATSATRRTTRPCGFCDVCAPTGDGGAAVAPADARRRRRASCARSTRCGSGTVRPRGSSTARWHDAVPERREFEGLLGGLARAGLVRPEPGHASRRRAGRSRFQRAFLTPGGDRRRDGSRGGSPGGDGARIAGSTEAPAPQTPAQAPADRRPWRNRPRCRGRSPHRPRRGAAGLSARRGPPPRRAGVPHLPRPHAPGARRSAPGQRRRPDRRERRGAEARAALRPGPAEADRPRRRS